MEIGFYSFADETTDILSTPLLISRRGRREKIHRGRAAVCI